MTHATARNSALGDHTLKHSFVLLSSFAPLALFITTALFTPSMFISASESAETILVVDGWIRIAAAALLVCGLCFDLWYVWRSQDPRLGDRRGVWSWLLILGNVFALPVFWFLFLRARPQAD